jgi:hypothetical protein
VALPERLPIPDGEDVRRARAYVAKMEAAVFGHSGDFQTWKVACVLVIDFDLSPETALPILLEYNERCVPPWTLEALKHKLAAADALPNRARGSKRRPGGRHICVNVRPDDHTIYVGVDCADDSHSYVSMSSMGAGFVKVGVGRELAAELAVVAWDGKQVLLTPLSTIHTNSQDVWTEFFVATLLRLQGATVYSIHIQPHNGRKRTFSQAGGECEIVEPPFNPWDAAALAKAASQRAQEIASYRKSLPRAKGNPKLQKALDFVRSRNVRHMTKDVIAAAKRKGIRKSTLRRAIQQVLIENNESNTSNLIPYRPHATHYLCSI